MSRLHDLDLIGPDGLTRHQDDIDEALADLCEHAKPPEQDNPLWETTCHLRVWFDPNERRLHRRKQRAQFGRYMHQSVSVWNDVDLMTFSAYYHALCDILDAESPMTSPAENRA